MRLPKTLSFLALGLGLAACAQTPPPAPVARPMPPPVVAPAAPNVSDLVNARAASGAAQLTELGFTRTRSAGSSAYWSHEASSTCVRTVTANGRYRTVAAVPATSCAAPAPATRRR